MSEKMTTANNVRAGNRWTLTMQSARFRSGADADL